MSFSRTFQPLFAVAMVLVCQISLDAQDDSKNQNSEKPAGQRSATEAVERKENVIVLETRRDTPKPPLFFSATAKASATIGKTFVRQAIDLRVRIVQGTDETISVGLSGGGEVVKVTGANLKSWAVRREGESRLLDLRFTGDSKQHDVKIQTVSDEYTLPGKVMLAHLTGGDAVGFDYQLTMQSDASVAVSVVNADGFVPVGQKTGDSYPTKFQSGTGGKLELALRRSSTVAGPVELVDTRLSGQLQSDKKSVDFRLQSTAIVHDAGAEVEILSGGAALGELPEDAKFQVRLLMQKGRPVYKLLFPEVGRFDIDLNFVARLIQPSADSQGLDFVVAASAVVPLALSGLDAELTFQRAGQTVVPLRNGNKWSGFLPASGQVKLRWDARRKTGEGKLFYSTTGRIDTHVGTGLMRQDHAIDYKVLQGELKSLQLLIDGPGEILDVQGQDIVAWNVAEEDSKRRLDITLSRPITSAAQLTIRSQSPLAALPARADGLRLNPVNAIRHSGHLRISNAGSVRLEPTGLSGLTQLSPEQFPGEPSVARQVFVYRFPAASHDFAVAVDRIQPEISVSQVTRYELTETDRSIVADIEYDIRQAPVRSVDLSVPADYSIVSVTGADVTDYVAASQANGTSRNLKVIFGKDVGGRVLISVHLEMNETAENASWSLQKISFPGVKNSVGNIGIVAAPGFRVSADQTDMLVEIPVSYFPRQVAGLQQAFRLRQPDWTAQLKVEKLPRSVQADVFHLYSLSQETVYGSALINYFVTGAPVSQWKITVPESIENVMIDGRDVRSWRRDGDTVTVTLHQAVMDAYTLLMTFEQLPDEKTGAFVAGQVAPLDVQGDRGFIQVVSPMQVDLKTQSSSEDLLQLDPLELPAEFRLLSTAPALGTWQYTQRPFDLTLQVEWFSAGTTVPQVVEYSEVNSLLSRDGEQVTEVVYFVKSRGQRSLSLKLPGDPVRLWASTVNGETVNARQDGETTLIPMPGNVDPNEPVEVRLRLGKPAVNQSRPMLDLPVVMAPVLKAHWRINGQENHVLVDHRGSVTPAEPVLRPSGFAWLASDGLLAILFVGLLAALGLWLTRQQALLKGVGVILLIVAGLSAGFAARVAGRDMQPPAPLELDMPILAAGESVGVEVKSVPLWQSNLNWAGIAIGVVGIASVVISLMKLSQTFHMPLRLVGGALVAAGLLMQRDGAALFWAVVSAAILLVFVLPMLYQTLQWLNKKPDSGAPDPSSGSEAEGPGTSGAEAGPATAMIALVLSLVFGGTSGIADDSALEINAADSITQQWSIASKESRLTAQGSMKVTGKPGDAFVLLRSPAVLTSFESADLRLSKRVMSDKSIAYVVTIPVDEKDDVDSKDAGTKSTQSNVHVAEFQYQVESVNLSEAVAVLTGNAAVQKVGLEFDQPGWSIGCASAVSLETSETKDSTNASLLLAPGPAALTIRPMARDLSSEKTQFFVEGANLFMAGPGVIDGRHRLSVRTSQGQVRTLSVAVPKGLTVSNVGGPVKSWQFDADRGVLQIETVPTKPAAFAINIETQRGLDPLPAEVKLAPLRAEEADGEIGLIAVAFGVDTQPEELTPIDLSSVNLGDFDSSMVPEEGVTLHRVYHYGADGGSLGLRVAPVEPDVRVLANQSLSLGDERTVLNVGVNVEITRAGLFQLSFPLPAGMEVESLTGPALHHWSELTEGDTRNVILHLNGKTIGTHAFHVVLAGTSPKLAGTWAVPGVMIDQASRQTGQLVVSPTVGIRLRAASRQNVSEIDPRSIDTKTTIRNVSSGAVAFRLLQRNWSLELEIEKLDPWVTGSVLHEVTLREGQTQTVILGSFDVQNASTRSLLIKLPISDEDEIKTVRSNSRGVSDLVRTAPDSDLWKVQFKRRVVGNVQFRIEYQRRGERAGDSEVLQPAAFPEARQLAYFVSVRSGGRLDVAYDRLPDDWQVSEWNAIPRSLRDSHGGRTPATIVLRAAEPMGTLTINAQRHSLADSLKLRVAKGSLTTILSPTGDQLTEVDLTMEVIQRSSLAVKLPADGELFNIFVNGESVHSTRQKDKAGAWQFYILPGIDDRTASVKFVYSVSGNNATDLRLRSPLLSVPLENIRWHVFAPPGHQLTSEDGNLELVDQRSQRQYDLQSYLKQALSSRKKQANQANSLLEQANRLLQSGDQQKANWAFNCVANQYALDAASNEDARVQLKNLQTQQAIVGLNTRRQRLFLDNVAADESQPRYDQYRQAAVENRVLQDDRLNFRPQEMSQLLRGNTSEDNAVLLRIADRLVRHQRTAEPAPQAIVISLPNEGEVYTFSRGVQVAENAPLELQLGFQSQRMIPHWKSVAAIVLVLLLIASLALLPQDRRAGQGTSSGLASLENSPSEESGIEE